jgi:hypothetical protein
VRIAEFQPDVGTGEVDLDPMVVSQLRAYITTVAHLYRSSNVNETIIPDGTSVRNNFVAAVRMADFQPCVGTGEVDLDPMVVSQLRTYITTVAHLYRNSNAFHNFEHASHVIMSTVKLLQRVATTDEKK